jgi:hypothetical protein
MFSSCLNLNAGLYIGWTVTQGATSMSTGAPLYNLTYVPFLTLSGQVNVSVSSYPALVSYGVTLQIVNVQIPTYLAIGQNALCYSSMLSVQPGAIYTSVNTALLQCAWYVTPLQSSYCSTVQGPTFQQFFWPLWSGYMMSFVMPGCINFGGQ